MNGKRIIGKNYSPPCGRCDVPPWLSCACSALLAEFPEVEPVPNERMADTINADAQIRLELALEEIG